MIAGNRQQETTLERIIALPEMCCTARLAKSEFTPNKLMEGFSTAAAVLSKNTNVERQGVVDVFSNLRTRDTGASNPLRVGRDGKLDRRSANRAVSGK
jgi:hypothetical protein